MQSLDHSLSGAASILDAGLHRKREVWRPIQKGIDRIVRSADRWWYVPAVSFLSALDAYLLVIPNEPIIAASVMARPACWRSLTVWMTLANALGAVSLAALVGTQSDRILGLLGGFVHSESWRESVRVINRHGGWGLALISLSPFPQHAAVIFAGLIRMSLWKVFFGVTVGRAPKYLAVGWFAAKSPDVLRRWRLI